MLFDIDGTLVDTLPALIPGLGDAYERFAGFRPTDAFIRQTIGTPLVEQMRLFQLHEPDGARLAEAVAFAIERFEAYADREQSFGAAVQALIEVSRLGLSTALVTSKSQVELASFLDRFEAAAFVDVAVCASDVEKPKPHAESALLACERLGIRPSQAVLIGDSIFDIQCAKRAELAACYAVTYGAGAYQALLDESPDGVFNTPESVLQWARELSQTPCLEGRS